MASRDQPKEGDRPEPAGKIAAASATAPGGAATPKSSVYRRFELRTKGGTGTPPGFPMNPRATLIPKMTETQSQSQGTLIDDLRYPQLPGGFEDNQDSNRDDPFPFSSSKLHTQEMKTKSPFVTQLNVPKFNMTDNGQPEMSEKRQGKQRARAQRFTIEPGDLQDEVLLTDITEDDANTVFTVINSTEDFVANALKSPEE